MVQGGLLTTHPGSVHGGGEASGGGSPLRQGAGKSSPDAPDLESAAAVEQRRDREKGFCPRGFRDEWDIYAKGGSQRRSRGPRRPPGPPLAPLWPIFGSSRSFLYADFSYIFPGIFGALLIWGKPEIEKQQKTGTGTVVH